MRRLGRRMMEVREDERGRIARDLHDIVGQALAGARLMLISIREGLEPTAAIRVQDTVAALDQAMAAVRTFSTELRPDVLENLGLESAIRWHVYRVARDSGIEASFDTSEVPPKLGRDLELACYRVCQEALANVVRHAGARSVRVRLAHRPRELELTVTDDGIGFDVASAQRRADAGDSLGLDAMAERVRLVDGSVAIVSSPGAGTSVTATFPTTVTGEPRLVAS
ncbi:MAG TPA: sensor histidine kinase [Candidatus Limnocylindrales bacterium]